MPSINKSLAETISPERIQECFLSLGLVEEKRKLLQVILERTFTTGWIAGFDRREELYHELKTKNLITKTTKKPDKNY